MNILALYRIIALLRKIHKFKTLQMTFVVYSDAILDGVQIKAQALRNPQNARAPSEHGQQ